MAPAADRSAYVLVRERMLAALATRQHGVVGRKQLEGLGLTRSALDGRVRAGRLNVIHRGVYAVGHTRVSQRGDWTAAVLACGEGAVLSHQSAAALWGLCGSRTPVDVTSSHGRPGRKGIRLHRARLRPDERTTRDGIPVTTVERTLLDLADVVDPNRLQRLSEEADRLNLLRITALERICDRGTGRRGVGACRRLVSATIEPAAARSALEHRFARFCDDRQLPRPAFNTEVLGYEVDALWPDRKLVVELDGFVYHRHRAAFERDRARDAVLQAAGYRVIRLTHRRLDGDEAAVASQLRVLLAI